MSDAITLNPVDFYRAAEVAQNKGLDRNAPETAQTVKEQFVKLFISELLKQGAFGQGDLISSANDKEQGVFSNKSSQSIVSSDLLVELVSKNLIEQGYFKELEDSAQ